MTRSEAFEICNIDANDIVINRYEVNENIKKAKQIIEQYEDFMSEKVNVCFEENIWVFLDLASYFHVYFNFEIIENSLKFNNTLNGKTLLNAVKCWCAMELENKALTTVKRELGYLLSAIYTTNGFDHALSKKILDLIEQSSFYMLNHQNEYVMKKGNSNSILEYINIIIKFLKFYDGDSYSYFTNLLTELTLKYKNINNIRKLPSFKDMLKLKMYLEEWFETVLKQNNYDELMEFYTLILWFKLTLIIPLRPLEFCKIKKNCLSIIDSIYYITFPRFKFHRKGEHRVKITYDTLPIPKDLYEIFENYIRFTANSNNKVYLLDYQAYKIHTKSSSNGRDKKIPIFELAILSRMIFKFYIEIIHKQYKVNILSAIKDYKEVIQCDPEKDSIQSMILAGDLRHMAIINMMMQGFDKVEIQRLAGHVSEETQFGYYSHMENWMNVEINRLEREFTSMKPLKTSSDGSKLVDIHPKVYDFFDGQYKRFYVDGDTNENYQSYSKLSIGYCKDKSMPCPTFNWKHTGCYFCEHWSILLIELEEKKDIIICDMNLIYEELKGKVNFMKALYNSHLDELGNVDHNIKRDLSSTANEVELGMKHVAELRYMLGVEVYE